MNNKIFKAFVALIVLCSNVLGVSAQSYTGVEPENNGEYYIYCPSKQLFVDVAEGVLATTDAKPESSWTVIYNNGEYQLKNGNYYLAIAKNKGVISAFAASYPTSVSLSLNNNVYNIFKNLKEKGTNEDYYLGIANSIGVVQANDDASRDFIFIKESDELMYYTNTKSNTWGTLVLPHAIQYNPSECDYALYELSAVSIESEETGTLTFSECQSGTIAAGTPLAVKAEGVNEFTLNCLCGKAAAVAPSSVNGYTITGTFESLTDQTGMYFIAQNKFWYAESPITIPAYRAYITGPSARASFRIVEANEETGLNVVEDGTMYINNGTCYDLQGRQTNSQKGLQVRNGKVIMIK